MIKPIIFSTESVQAIVDGRKTMTRRVVKPQPEFAQVYGYKGKWLYNGEERVWCYKDHVSPSQLDEVGWITQFAPYQPGDLLWVREKWRTVDYEYCDGKWSASVEYSDGAKGDRVFWYDNSDVGIPYDGIYSTIGWRSPIYMPREAARLFLRVTDVRVERLQEIMDYPTGLDNPVVREGYVYGCDFIAGWNRLNSKRGCGWDTNPWVWTIIFEVCEKPEGWPKA